jgi:hypothetical protein
MVVTNIRPVQGFKVFSLSGKGGQVKVVLKGPKDDLRSGDGDVGDILKSLELHSTAGEGAPVDMSLLHTHDETNTYAQPFIVNTVTVKQDDIKVTLELLATEDGESSRDVVKSLFIHSESETDVELVLARVDT